MKETNDNSNSDFNLVWPDQPPAPAGTKPTSASGPQQHAAKNSGNPKLSADLPKKGKSGASLAADLPKKFNKASKGRTAKGPASNWQRVKRLLLATTVGFSGCLAYDQLANDYQKEWVADAVKIDAPREKTFGFIPMSLEERYAMAHHVPDEALAKAKERVAAVESELQALPGFDDVDFSTEDGRNAAYAKSLNALVDYDNPIIQALQYSEDHKAETAAIEFIELGGKDLNFGSENERIAVHAAVFLSLKLGGHDAHAEEAYHQLNDAFTKPDEIWDRENRALQQSTQALMHDIAQIRAVHQPRAEIRNQHMAGVQYENREEIYQATAKALLQQFDIPATPLVMAQHAQLGEMMPEMTETEFSAKAQANPFKIGDEIIAVNYDDSTLKRPFWQPQVFAPFEQQWDPHTYPEVGTAAVAKAIYEIDAQRHAEKFLMSYYVGVGPEYSFGVMAAMDKIAEYSGMDTSNSKLSEAADSFSKRFMVAYTGQSYRYDRDQIHPAYRR